MEGLEAILQELQLELPEFDDINLDELADDLGIELDNLDSGEEDDGKADDVPEAPEKTVIKVGDIIRLAEHELIVGESAKKGDVSQIISRWCQYTGNREVMINDKVVEWEEYCSDD